MDSMDERQAIALALDILEPFREAGNIYEEYKSSPPEFTDEEYEAMLSTLRKLNTRLIAALPELLAACKLAVEVMGSETGRDGVHECVLQPSYAENPLET